MEAQQLEGQYQQRVEMVRGKHNDMYRVFHFESKALVSERAP